LKVKTTRFGTITITQDKIITMPLGMLGFPNQKRFVILQHKENSPFFWYQSVDDPNLTFVITNPFTFKPDYQIDLTPALKEMFWNGDGNNSHLELYVVVNIPKGAPQKMTGNLMSPVLINNKARQAVQIVIADSTYSHKYPLIDQSPQP
jgi:flagellar assembly factor FliW